MPSVVRSKNTGNLFVVSTPIGNLEDITLRAIRVLKEVDIIAAENIRRAKLLLKYFDINKEVISFRRENQKGMTIKIMNKLEEGHDVALISDAGTPGISDPGAYLVNYALDKGLRVIPVPGPSAITTAISVSGFSIKGFIFTGFLPISSGKRKKLLKSLSLQIFPIVFFEAPHRLLQTLKDIKDIMGNRKIVVFKELTKLHEKILRDKVGTILKKLCSKEIKGEYVIIVSGLKKDDNKENHITYEVVSKIDQLLKNGFSTKDIAKLVSADKGLTYREIYRKCLERKKLLYGDCKKA